MKRFLITLLALTMLALLAVPALAEESSPWEYNTSAYYLQRVSDLSGDVIIPAEVDGCLVNALEPSMFSNQHEITSLTMPDTLRAMQSGAINTMDGLTAVTLNDGLEYIGANNFLGCHALTSVTIPASVRIIKSSFNFCDALKEIHFEGPCPMLMDPDLSFSVLPEDYVIYVPDDQLEAYQAAFAGCWDAVSHMQPSGKNAVIPESVVQDDWFNFDAETGTITGYKEYHACLEIPASIGGVPVKAIGKEAFLRDYSVYSLVIPEGVERIEEGAFSAASNITYLKLPSTVRTIGDDAFFNTLIDQIDWSEGLEEIGARAFQYNGFIRELRLPGTVKCIGESAFEGWGILKDLYLANQMEHIGSRAFAKSGIHYMAFDLYAPIDIASDAFAENKYLADLDLPWDSSFENRDAYAALLAEQCPDCTVWINNPISSDVAECPENESEITTITDGVWTVYNGTLPDLTIWTAYDEINVTALGDGLFKGSQTIHSFYPHHCGWFTTIGREAFADSSVAYVELFGSITTIGEEAFRSCQNLTEVSLPKSLTTLSAGAYRDCANLTKVTIPADAALTVIDANTFAGCVSLTEVTLPDTLTEIGENAFENCASLTELTLPASLTSISADALNGCTALTRLTVLCDPVILPEGLLESCSALTEIYANPAASNEEVQTLSALVGYPWYSPVPRVGEQRKTLTEMPYAPLPEADFWYDADYARLDQYRGYELNLVLPREVGGVKLSMIGGGMMGRASSGDNYEVELPVRSLVIPENYTDLPYWVFSNCETLETVICYAPIETLNDCLFTGCTNLREVIFVNGVRNVGMNIFDNCPKLETIYLGHYVDEINDKAWLNQDGTPSFDPDACIVDELPDVDALLLAVKSEPMPTPEPTATPAPAMPIGAEGAAFFGTWKAESMDMDGEVYNVAEMGMVMDLTLNADGTCSVFDGEEYDYATWTFADGVGTIDGMAVTLTEDGHLCMEEDGSKMLFARADGAAVPTVTPTSAPATEPAGDMSAYLGDWYCVSMAMEGQTYDLAAMGMNAIMTLSEDGSAVVDMAGDINESTWSMNDGVLIVDDAPLTLEADGTLKMDQDGLVMIFSREKPVVTGPSAEDLEAYADYLGMWYCVQMGLDDEAIHPADWGMEVTLTIGEDGSAVTDMAGDVQTMAWMPAENGVNMMGMICSLQEDGTLYCDADGEVMIFAREAYASVPTAEPTTEPTLEPTTEPAPEPTTVPTAEPTVEMIPADQRMDVKYVCLGAMVEGFGVESSMLGGEYVLTFHEDGTADFTMAGMEVPGGLKWKQVTQFPGTPDEVESFVIDYYGNEMTAYWTETGFELDYFGSMLMVFETEETAEEMRLTGVNWQDMYKERHAAN